MKIGFPVNRNEFGQLQTRAHVESTDEFVSHWFVGSSAPLLNGRNYLFDADMVRWSFFDTSKVKECITLAPQMLCYKTHLLTGEVQSARRVAFGFNFSIFMLCFSRDHCRVSHKWKHFERTTRKRASCGRSFCNGSGVLARD